LSRPDRVSDALRANVHAAAVSLGYRVRQPVRAPERGGGTAAIIWDQRHGVWVRVAEGLANALERQGLTTLRIASAHERAWSWVDAVSAIAWIGLRPPESVLARAAAGEPRLVTVGEQSRSAAVQCHIDYPAQAGLAMALAGLRSLGHRRIGRWPGWPMPSDAAATDADRAADTLRRWCEREAMTALICDDAPTAAWAVLAAQDAGLRVPEALSIVALADHPMLRVVSPSITAISEPIGEIVRVLVREFVRDGEGAINRPSFKARVAVRASTTRAIRST
jgi:DNA-binding LacI/PurR family transcriptional regulator